MRKHYGKCALCGIEGELTYEHIPPRAANNYHPVKTVVFTPGINPYQETIEQLPWDMDGMKYINQQKGYGLYTLCAQCNNNIGSWYASEYVLFSKIASEFVQESAFIPVGIVDVWGIHPLRIIKHVLSMFCSLNDNIHTKFDGYEERMQELREFILDKHAKNLNKSHFRVEMYFTYSELKKTIGFSRKHAETAIGQESIVLSEITKSPLGFVLYLDPTQTWDYPNIDITSFAEYEYDDVCEFRIPVLLREVNDIIPESYRSKEEIIKCYREGKTR